MLVPTALEQSLVFIFPFYCCYYLTIIILLLSWGPRLVSDLRAVQLLQLPKRQKPQLSLQHPATALPFFFFLKLYSSHKNFGAKVKFSSQKALSFGDRVTPKVFLGFMEASLAETAMPHSFPSKMALTFPRTLLFTDGKAKTQGWAQPFLGQAVFHP